MDHAGDRGAHFFVGDGEREGPGRVRTLWVLHPPAGNASQDDAAARHLSLAGWRWEAVCEQQPVLGEQAVARSICGPARASGALR